VAYLPISHFIVTSDHLPPARSQSARLVWPDVGGLADGVVPRSTGPDGAEPVGGPGAGVAAASLPVEPGALPPVLPDTPPPVVDGLPGAWFARPFLVSRCTSFVTVSLN
jgi:hypothetical protein